MTPEFDPGFSTPQMAELFSARSRVGAMCRVEAALALAMAEAGAMPADAADEIASACEDPITDPDDLLGEGWEAGTPLIPLLDRIRFRLSAEVAAHLHRGATSQDIIDTALMLLTRDGCRLLEADLREIAARLRHLAVAHRATAMTGRTFLQHGEATTFGLRVAQWLDPVLGAVSELEVRAANLPVQLGGPVGVASGFGPAWPGIVERFAADLGLAAPRIPWHGDRRPVTATAALAQEVAGAMAKIGIDLALLSQTEIAEVDTRSGGSSSMPGKRNPIDAVRAVAAAEVCRAVAGIVTQGRPHELERAVGGWHAEWFALPVALQAAAATTAAIATATASLRPDPERMASNLGTTPPDEVLVSAGLLVDRVVAAADAVLGPAS